MCALFKAWVDPSAGQFPSVNSMGGLPFNLVDNYQNVSPMTSNPVGSRPPPPPQQPKQEKGDDIIKTAIVIKNIPFALKKEILQAIMMEMQLPMPYAFNYHFEGDAFRGLAFANFLNEEDTAHVIAKLNQQEIMGRKLRVEYKKQLPDHERERIEREKKEKRGQLRMQHEPMSLHQQSSLQSLTSALTSNMQPRSSPLRKDAQPRPLRVSRGQSLRDSEVYPGPQLTNTRPFPGDVDFNDPETLEFYTQLTLFKNDPSREILIFPSSITPEQRRHIHILAHNMGLQHQSIGEADQRQLQITKKDSPAHAQPSGLSALTPSITYDAHRRGLSRAATIDFAESRTGGAGGHFGSVRQGGATLEVPGSPDGGIPSNLRAAKSFADLRSYTPSPSSVSSYVNQGPGAPPTSASNGLGAAMRYGEYTKLNQSGSLVTPPNLTPTTPGNTGVGSSTPGGGPESLLSSLGSMSLGYDHSSTIGHPQPARSNPGAIGSQRPSAAAAQAQANADKVAAERQPRGPGVGWETAGGFGSRTRSNGHMQRGSGKC